MANNMYMDDVGDITVEVITLIQKRLTGYDTVLSTPEEDALFDSVFSALGLKCVNDYKQQNG